jgi:arylsulfatase A-like enzyme
MTSYGYANHAIRGERYRYIRFVAGSEELYDHREDPNEWTNLADDPAYAEVKQRLAQQLPDHSAALTPVTSRTAVNDHFAEMYRKAGIEPRIKN